MYQVHDDKVNLSESGLKILADKFMLFSFSFTNNFSPNSTRECCFSMYLTLSDQNISLLYFSTSWSVASGATFTVVN